MGKGRSAWPRPADMGFLPFWPNFARVVPAFKYSLKLVELINISGFNRIMALNA